MFMRARSRRRLSEMWPGYRSGISQAQPHEDDKVKACALILSSRTFAPRVSAPAAGEAFGVARLLPVTRFGCERSVFRCQPTPYRWRPGSLKKIRINDI